MHGNFVSIGTFENGERYDIQENVDKLIERTILNGLNGKNFSEIISENSKIVIKPNFVNESNLLIGKDKKNETVLNECFITNRAVIKALFRMFQGIKGLQIKILEAPIQFCRIEKIVTPDFLKELREIYSLGTIQFIDLRRTIYVPTEKEPIVKTNLRDSNLYVDIDIAEKSEHELCGRCINKFRVTDYPPEEMKKFHSQNRHIYRVAYEIFDADFIFNIPKLKTHMKAGLTGASKNFVGVIGNKECLPHHTKGSKYSGGDCYGDISLIKKLAEDILDDANSYIVNDNKKYWKKRRWARILLELKWLFGGDNDIGGSWYGNDTIWRTIVDINRIIYYGSFDGTLKREKQRVVYTLIDAIVAGQNEGPMSPQPYYLGSVIFSESTSCADIAAALMMGFDYRKIKYLNLNILKKNYPLVEEGEIKIHFNEEKKLLNLQDLEKKIVKCAVPAERWIGHIEREDFVNRKNEYSYFRKTCSNFRNTPKRLKDEFNRFKQKDI